MTSLPLSEDPLSSALNVEAQVSWAFGFYLGVGIRSLFPVPLESAQVSPASHLRCILSRCGHGKKANFECGPGLWGYMPFSLQWICATFQGLFCLHDGNIVFFFSLKTYLYLVSLPCALLPPPQVSTAPPATDSCEAFVPLGFSLSRSEIAAPVVFSKLTLSWF